MLRRAQHERKITNDCMTRPFPSTSPAVRPEQRVEGDGWLAQDRCVQACGEFIEPVEREGS